MDDAIGASLSIGWAAPFGGLLLSIALVPLVAPRFWERRHPHVAAMWAVVFAAPFVAVHSRAAVTAITRTALVDYAPFLILLWGLFTVSGGLVVRGAGRGTPGANAMFLIGGAVLASLIGTTGAAMTLIRPLLRANARRTHKVHTVIFFIFLVANIGGALTPLGDPPLFLGFLHGVPFFWTLRLIAPMGLCVAILLPLYFLIDHRAWRREDAAVRAPGGDSSRLALAGRVNLLLLAGILGAVLLSGTWRAGTIGILGVDRPVQDLCRDILILLMGGLSLVLTPRALRRENEFSWAPIKEVAFLFAGIFATIIPVLAILRAGEQGALGWLIRGVTTPAHYFWATGVLSSVLDNAPTYLAFFNALLGRFHPGLPEAEAVRGVIAAHGVFLEALAAGAVFMGANTYIGNAPNFMVKSIAEDAGVEMPSFFGYILRWSLPILLPTFLLVTLLFLGHSYR